MTALTIAWHGIVRLRHERQALFWMFVGPVIFATFFGVLFRPAASRPAEVTIINRDADDFVARALAAALKRDGFDVRRAQASGPSTASSGWRIAIPAGAAEAMAGNTEVEIVLHAGEEETNAERSLRFRIPPAGRWKA